LKSLSEDWVEVYHGNAAVAEMVHARLREHGVRAFVPDRNLRYVDADATGGNVFELRVLVERRQWGRARYILELDAAAGAMMPDGGEDALERELREVQRLGDRIIASALFGYLSPLALILAPRYFKLARALPMRPRRHRSVQAATLIASLLVSACVALLALTPW
jgi:hypothetical protein